MREELRVALAGFGLAGRYFHAPLINASPRLRLHAVVTSREVPPGVRRLGRLDEVLGAANDYDLLVVATPNATHAPLATAALAAGLPVVVDKPLALTVADAEALVAQAGEGMLTVFHNRRWDSDTLTVQRLLADGDLGEVYRFESRFERWRPERKPGWREDDPAQGGGVLLDLGAHLVDQALHLFGPVTAIYREVEQRRGGVDDDVFLALTHASGVRSHLWASAVAAQAGPRVRVLGSRAAYVKADLDGQEDAARAGLPSPPEPPGLLGADGVVREVASVPGNWRAFYDGVAAALLDGAPVPVDPRDAVEGLRILAGDRDA
jgi:predicted dehydrogenase